MRTCADLASSISHRQKIPDVAVVYLARCAEGLAAFQRFAESYRRQAAMLDHDLIVIYKGFEQQSKLIEARTVFDGLPHHGVELQDVGFDIGSYLEISRRVPHTYLCFLNTHSEIVAPTWLARLFEHAVRDGVGIVGAMGSYESLLDSVLFMRNVRWAHDTRLADCNRRTMAYYFDDLRRSTHLSPGTMALPWLPLAIRRALRYLLYRVRALSLVWPELRHVDIRRFPPFPNPHMRSNGFMVRRDRLLRFARLEVQSKTDAMMFESGREGLTATLRRAGFRAIVVGRDDRGYDIPEWPLSRTFRLGNQERLLVSDNQTRSFASLSAGAQLTQCRITWGDYAGAAPGDFPQLGFAFRKGSLSPATGRWVRAAWKSQPTRRSRFSGVKWLEP